MQILGVPHRNYFPFNKDLHKVFKKNEIRQKWFEFKIFLSYFNKLFCSNWIMIFESSYTYF